MQKLISLLFGILSYLFFLITLFQLIIFVGNLQFELLQYQFKTISGGGTTQPGIAITLNLILLAAFALQHSVMARPKFKSMLVNVIPKNALRSFYVLLASLMLQVMFYFWQPIDITIWDNSQSIAGTVLISISFFGWFLVVLSTFLINHFHLFGLDQVFRSFLGKPQLQPKFRVPFVYKMIRHPLYHGFLLAFWFTPLMTLGHLIFAVSMTAYILVGISYEERALVDELGEKYRAYQKAVPKLIPFTKKVPDQEVVTQDN